MCGITLKDSLVPDEPQEMSLGRLRFVNLAYFLIP